MAAEHTPVNMAAAQLEISALELWTQATVISAF